jgi:hypothetical protein
MRGTLRTVGLGARAAAGALAAALAFAAACARPDVPEDRGATLARRAEDARGLRFREPLVPRLVDELEAERVLALELDVAYPGGALARDSRAAQMLGLLPPGTDLRETILRFGREAVVGFYAPVMRRLYVVGREWPQQPQADRVEFESVVVHELAHALQDQHDDRIAAVLGLRERDDLSFALGALLEGEALYVEYADAERAEGRARPEPAAIARLLSARFAAAEYPDVPRAVREPFVLQYPLGYALVDALVREGGVRRLDEAALAPPLSSEQLLHPEKYLDPARRDAPLCLSLPAEGLAPAPDCLELHQQSYGELALRLWLSERLGAEPGADSHVEAEAAAAAEGWAGDRAVFFECAAGGAFGWLVRFDSPEEAREFSASAERALEELEESAGLAGPARAELSGDAVLVSAGLDASGRDRILRGARAETHADLAAFLAAHPEVLDRARSLRAAAAGAP